MDNKNNGSVTVTVALQEKKQSFLADEVQLKQMGKSLSKASKTAIDVLVQMLDSQDEKTRMTAAIKLVEFDIDVKKAISADQMQRLIAEVKLNGSGGSKTLEIEEAERKKRPIVDFSNIRAIG